jgi:predicted transcriptional regulator of viral defense system
MNAYQLYAQANREVVDYLFLKSALAELAYPRDKITELLRAHALVRVKKGLYVFGPDIAREPYHLETLANLIYGPSAISLEYALAFYGFIPERVATITSVTNKRNKYFSTPVGEFSYRYLHPDKYAVGLNRVLLNEKYPILIATPEKALADVLVLSTPKKLKNLTQLETYLLQDLRMDTEQLALLNLEGMQEIASVYHHANINLMLEYMVQ